MCARPAGALLAAALIQLPLGTIAVAPGQDGSIYSLRSAPPAVLVTDTTGAVLRETDIPDIASPAGMAVATDGTVAVSDRARGVIVLIGPEGTVRSRLRAPGSPGDLAWAGTSVWYCGLDMGAVAEAGTGRTILYTGDPPTWLDVSGRMALVSVGDSCLLFSETEGVTSRFDARCACFAGRAILLLTGSVARYDTSAVPTADSLGSCSAVLWLPGSGPAAFSPGRGLLRL